MAKSIARQSTIIRRSRRGVVSQLVVLPVCAAMAVATVAAPMAVADKPADPPPGCGVTWTMIGRSIIFMPDCAHPPPIQPPAGNQPPPQPEPPPPAPPN